MRATGTFLGVVCGLLAFVVFTTSGVAQSLADLQARFDRETSGVQKAKLMTRLGETQLEEARRAGRAGEYDSLGLTLEKYRDNVRAAVDALKNSIPTRKGNPMATGNWKCTCVRGFASSTKQSWYLPRASSRRSRL